MFLDPRFPDRPQHPDFWRLIEVILRLDGEVTEGARPIDEVMAETVDSGSLIYAAKQRALMLANGSPEGMAVLTALWAEAFLAGAEFQKAGGHRD